MTGYDDAIDGKLEADLPVVGILEKPFNVSELLEHVKVIVGNPLRCVRQQETKMIH